MRKFCRAETSWLECTWHFQFHLSGATVREGATARFGKLPRLGVALWT